MKNRKNIFLLGFFTLIAIIGGVFLFQNNEKNDILSSQNLQGTEQIDLQKEIPWVELKNTKYGYSLRRPVSTEVKVNRDGTGDGQIERTDKMDVAIVARGKGYGYFNVSIIDPNEYSKTEMPDLPLLYLKLYKLNLFPFVEEMLKEITLEKSPGIETKVSEITNFEIAGQKGYMFTVATTYTGQEKFDYPPTGLPNAYVFLEHNGNKIVLYFPQNDSISQNILASLKFD